MFRESGHNFVGVIVSEIHVHKNEQQNLLTVFVK